MSSNNDSPKLAALVEHLTGLFLSVGEGRDWRGHVDPVVDSLGYFSETFRDSDAVPKAVGRVLVDIHSQFFGAIGRRADLGVKDSELDELRNLAERIQDAVGSVFDSNGPTPT